MDEIYNVISYPNMLVYTFYDMNQKRYEQYIISKDINNIKYIINHLEKVQNQIGFGNLSKDYYALHHIIECRQLLVELQPEAITERIYNYLRQIECQEALPVASKDRYMNQLDLCNFWGFMSGNKNLSLTDVKIALDIYDVRELQVNYKLDESEFTRIQLEGQSNVKAIVKLYNISIGATNEERYTGINMIAARYALCEKYSLPGLNDTPMVFAQRYFQKIHSLNGGKDAATLLTEKNNNSFTIMLRECIPSFAIYEGEVFNRLVNTLSSTIVSDRSSFNYSTGYNGILLKFGVGGVHGCIQNGKYVASEDNMIVDIDIVSMYASIATSLGIKPRHTNQAFIDAMKIVLDERFESLSHDDNTNKGKVVILKQVLNYIYGKTKEEGNMFYDPKYSLDVTIAAQLFMAKFLELLRKRIERVKFLMVNTDSVTFMMKKSQKGELRQIYLKLKEIIPNLRFKIKSYDEIYIKDINNYIGKSSDKIIAKGIFDYNLDVMKDNSARVIPMAVKQYLFDNIDIDDSIDAATLMDFAFKAKINEGRLYYYCVEPGVGTSQTLIQNPSRYVYTRDYKKSGKIISKKNNLNNSITDVYPATIFNTYGLNADDINVMYYRTAIEDILGDFQYSNGTLKF